MKDKIDYAKCMIRKCEECKRYNYCFKYKGVKDETKKSKKKRI